MVWTNHSHEGKPGIFIWELIFFLKTLHFIWGNEEDKGIIFIIKWYGPSDMYAIYRNEWISKLYSKHQSL